LCFGSFKDFVASLFVFVRVEFSARSFFFGLRARARSLFVCFF
jgi:hypothetical protein